MKLYLSTISAYVNKLERIKKIIMKTKHKIAIISIITVLVLSVIGMTIGLVLVAQQATMNNSMTISYTANNVDCIVTASGLNYTSNNISEPITIANTNPANSTTHIVEFKATESGTNNSITKDGAKFNDIQMTATGNAVYKFEIKNTANENNDKTLKALATITNYTDKTTDNIEVKIGATEAGATEQTSYLCDIGGGQATNYIYVVITIHDATIDVNSFELSLNIQIGYDIETGPAPFDWSSATTTDNLDIIWGIRNRSGADFNITLCDTISETEYYNSQITNNNDYITTTAVPYNLDIYINTTQTTGKWLFTATYLTLDGSVITTSSDTFDASIIAEDYRGTGNGHGGFTDYSRNTGCLFKSGIIWGILVNPLEFNGGWYDTDIKILIEITPVD